MRDRKRVPKIKKKKKIGGKFIVFTVFYTVTKLYV